MTTQLARRDELSPMMQVALSALAGWLGWGIRGQIGHERGAMIPGSLIGLSLAFNSADPEVRRRAGLLGATGAMGMSFGGTETYAQTIGLTQGANWYRSYGYWWGMLGLAVKGGVWIGLCGTYLGMAASEKDYAPFEMMWLTAANTALWRMGVELVNRPHDPPGRMPRVYFSGESKTGPPRPEVWGGQWLALLGLLGHAAVKRDRTTLVMGAYGILGGAAGFAGAQAVQAWLRKQNLSAPGWRFLDTWKVMETGFGLIAGAFLGAGMMAARPSDRPLPPRARFSLEENALTCAAGTYALAEHLRDRRWTVRAMDSMVIAGLAIAKAFACDHSAWMQTLPLVHWYTAKDTMEHWGTIGMDPVIPRYQRGVLQGVGGLAVLGALLTALQRNGSRWAPGLGLIAAAWGQSMLSHIKMLLDPEVLQLGAGNKTALPPLEKARRVAERVIRKTPGQFATETAFAVAAVVLTGLVVYGLGKRSG